MSDTEGELEDDVEVVDEDEEESAPLPPPPPPPPPIQPLSSDQATIRRPTMPPPVSKQVCYCIKWEMF